MFGMVAERNIVRVEHKSKKPLTRERTANEQQIAIVMQIYYSIIN